MTAIPVSADLLQRLVAALERLDAKRSRTLLTTPEVCAKMNVSPDTWSRTYRGLIAERGFPDCVPGFPHHWDPEAIDAWLDRIGGLEKAMPQPAKTSVEIRLVEPANIDQQLEGNARR